MIAYFSLNTPGLPGNYPMTFRYIKKHPAILSRYPGVFHLSLVLIHFQSPRQLVGTRSRFLSATNAPQTTDCLLLMHPLQ